MTNEEALNQINSTNPFMQGSNKQEEYFNVIRKAIEKQIPKKPRASFQSGFFWCPSCGRAIKRRIEDSKINISYCPFCGRALDWGDTDG